jgi:N-acetyl sugar amidotransferase
VLPDTRPGLVFGDDGVCSACRAHGQRVEIDWDARRAAFEQLVADTRALGARWDCLIPVSGGKDSTWQTLKCLEAGLHPLAVTWKTPGRTELGQRNLDNLIELGVEHIDFQVNPKVERKFMLAGLERFGSTAIPMHMAIFNVPLNIAAKFEIPLVVWGEDSSTEYAGQAPPDKPAQLGEEWVRRYGVVHGTTARDWVSDDLSERDLAAYFGPGDDELAAKQIQAVFLGWFYEWDPAETAAAAAEHGFKGDESARTGFYSYADVDDDFISIHHWIKWFKFGFTRTFDNLSLEIRNGRLTRDEAIEILARRGDETPRDDIAKFCEYVGISGERFYETVERFRSTDVWTKRDGVWVIDGFLIDDFDWESSPSAA